MTDEKITVNPYDFGYSPDQLIGINGNSILNMMSLLEQVIATQPKIGALLQYPTKVNEVTDDEGNLVKVDIEWKEHTTDSFFYTAGSQNGGIPIMTDISLKCHQLLYGLSQIHQANINNKIAKKIEDKNAEKVFEA